MTDSTEMIGLQFGSLLVRTREANDKHGKKQWGCTCACGGWVVPRTDNLLAGRTTSCRKGGCPASGDTKRGRPSNESKWLGKSKAEPGNVFVEKIIIEFHYANMGGGMVYAFGAARGEGIGNYIVTAARQRPKRYNRSRTVPSTICLAMDTLMDCGYVTDQGDRTYEKWMVECGVTYREYNHGGMVGVNNTYDLIMRHEWEWE